MLKLSTDHTIFSARLAADIASRFEPDANCSPDVGEIRSLADRAEDLCKACPSGEHRRAWVAVSLSLRVAECALLQSEAVRGQGNATEVSGRGESSLVAAFLDVVDSDGVIRASAADLLRLISEAELPTVYYERVSGSGGFLDQSVPLTRKPAQAVLKLIAFLDKTPFVSPQLIRSNVYYSLEIEVRCEAWPTEANGPRLHFLTTLPSTAYEISKFMLERGDSEPELRACIQGSILLRSPQSIMAEPVVFSVCGEWCTASDSLPGPEIVGHNILTIRVGSDAVFASGYKRLDSHLHELLRKALSKDPTLQDELTALCPLLEALMNLLGQYAQGGVFRDNQKVMESDFREKTLMLLRTRLGEDIQEEVSQAGGDVDIRYRGVTLELKVVRRPTSQAKVAEKYGKQTAQYSGVEARRVGVLLVLDLSEKTAPPGDLRNYVSLHDVQVHGGARKSKVFLFVVNGNIRSPSEYSR